MSMFKNDQEIDFDQDVELERDSAANQPREQKNRLNEKLRASIWLGLAVCVFLCAVVMCLSLISRSAVTEETETFETHIKDIQYEVNGTIATDAPTEPIESTEPIVEMTVPVSVNDSTRFNYLIAAFDRETEQTDTLVILSIDTETATAALLSIPRDTYIVDSYEIPKINRVYGDNAERGARALVELTENMLGFRLDGHLIFDETVLAEVVDSLGGISFFVPSKPTYHGLNTGLQTINGSDAFELFRYNEGYNNIEIDSCQIQRNYLIKILDALLQKQEEMQTYAQMICDGSTTDLTPDILVYFATLLKDYQFANAFDTALPGEEIRDDGELFFQVDVEAACQQLNEHFNPLDRELDKFTVNFRQQHGDQGLGEPSDWETNNTTEPTSEDDPEPTERPETTEKPEPTESTEDTQETEEPEPTEEPTEETSDEPIETNEPTQEPTEPTETPEPLEPNEPGGDE